MVGVWKGGTGLEVMGTLDSEGRGCSDVVKVECGNREPAALDRCVNWQSN